MEIKGGAFFNRIKTGLYKSKLIRKRTETHGRVNGILVMGGGAGRPPLWLFIAFILLINACTKYN